MTTNRAFAATETLLVLPAALFMTALFVRNWQPQQYEPAHTAQRIVQWYAGLGPHLGLGVLLIGLPVVVLVLGVASLGRNWMADESLRRATAQTVTAIRAHFAMVVVAAATLAAFGILSIVAVHMIAD